MTVEPGIALTVGAFCVGGVVWLVRLEGRIDKGEQRTQDLANDISEIKEDVKTLVRRSYGARATDQG
jgi:hypothetical protein